MTPDRWDLLAEWRVWASQLDIGPMERRNIAMKKIFNCIVEKDPSLDLSGLSLTLLPTLPEWLTELDISDNALTKLPNKLPKN